jgi:DNA (cytosine-5)-methyltransferase 1
MGKAREELTILDLFAGAGGMALGFEAAGARCIGAVERDPVAGQTLQRLFGPEGATIVTGPAIGEDPGGDLTRLRPEELLRRLPAPPDLVVGGPPCQGFSRIGRAKQRSLAGARLWTLTRTLDPVRDGLYITFLEVVAAAQPLAFVMENVPGMREGVSGGDLAARIATAAERCGYNVRYFLLNAAWYCVPQHRWRLFFVGLRSDLGHRAIPRPPKRTHDAGPLMPEGGAFPEDSRMLAGDRIPAVRRLSAAVTVAEAIGDLPKLRPDEQDVRPAGEGRPFRREPSLWALAMRNWPGRPADELVTGNWYRSTPRDYRIFRDMAHGHRYPDAVEIAHMLFEEEIARLREEGRAPKPGSKAYAALRKAVIPPYRNDAFDDKWAKLHPDRPSWTVTAHLSKDSYSHIHYDSGQHRTITIREAARLQSFPDAVEFCGSYGDQFRQIGNAVPPLMARAIATELLAHLHALQRKRPARATRLTA